MSEIRKNIFFSILIHTAIITAVFTMLGSSKISRKDFMSVFLLEGFHKTEKAGENSTSPAKSGPLKKATHDTDIVPLRTSNPHITDNIPPAQPVISTGSKPVSASADQTPAVTGQASTTSGESISPHPVWNDTSTGENSQTSVGLAVRTDIYNKTKNTDYINAIRSAIEKNLIYPSLARRNRIEGTVLTDFSINAEGVPENIRVVKSSGYNVLDSAALETITRASPFPPIKESIEIPITFVLKK